MKKIRKEKRLVHGTLLQLYTYSAIDFQVVNHLGPARPAVNN